MSMHCQLNEWLTVAGSHLAVPHSLNPISNSNLVVLENSIIASDRDWRWESLGLRLMLSLTFAWTEY